MNIFVTGTRSFIGGALLKLCAERGVTVCGIDAVGGGAETTVCDVRSSDVADLIPENVDAVVHLAALSRDPDCRNKAQLCFDVNVMGTLNVMEAARRRHARQFILASSEWVYDRFVPGVEKTEDDVVDPLALNSEYALSKLVSEANVRQAVGNGFCAAAILRLGIVYGPRRTNMSAVEALTTAVAEKDEVTVGALATARRFIHVDDVAAGILASVGREGLDTFNIQGPELVSLERVIKAAEAATGRHPAIRETGAGLPSIRPVSSIKAERLLGWRARIGIEDGVRTLAEGLGIAASLEGHEA